MVAAVNLKKNEPWEGFPPRRGFGPSTFASLIRLYQGNALARLSYHGMTFTRVWRQFITFVPFHFGLGQVLGYIGGEWRLEFRFLRGFTLTRKCKCNRKVRTKG